MEIIVVDTVLADRDLIEEAARNPAKAVELPIIVVHASENVDRHEAPAEEVESTTAVFNADAEKPSAPAVPTVPKV